MTKIEKIDNSFSLIRADDKRLNAVMKMLSVEKENWQYDYLIRIGRVSKYRYYFENYGEFIKVANGVLEIPPIRETLGLPESEYLEDFYEAKSIEDLQKIKESQKPRCEEDLILLDKIDQSISDVKEILDTCDFPFAPFEYQELAAIKGLTKEITLLKMCTGSGKSFTISILLEYFRRKGLKGALIVPNTNLLTQFANDIKSYHLNKVHKGIIKLGGGSKKTEELESKESFKNSKNFLILTTWQSLKNLKSEIYDGLDFIICDEVHRFSSDCTSQLVLDSSGAKYKLGFTGTLPKAKTSLMTLLGLFGIYMNIIESHELISMGRGTPIKIHGIKLTHTAQNSFEISRYKEYLDRIKFIHDIEERNVIITKLARNLSQKNMGSTLILYNLIDHGVQIFRGITGEDPGDIERQEELGVFFMDGSVRAKDREFMRVALDKNPEAILVANYSLLSTGVNIKSLRFAIFASPLKSFTSITQSLGRGIRTAEGKEVFEVYDIIDHFPSGPRTFNNSANSRQKIYESQKFHYDEKVIKL